MKNLLQKISLHYTTNRAETWIFALTALWGSIFAYYVYSLGLTTLLVDQNAHLNIARLVTDSVTPGISQIGFWPALIHIVLAPFVSVDFLYQTGLAGAAALVPIFALGAVFVYRILLMLTDNTHISFGGVALFATNPYILYYTSTPMTETLFIVTLLGVVYFFLKWLETNLFRDLIYLGLFITIASVARFEGFLLIPIVGTLIALELYRKGKTYHEIEAVSILFGLVAIIGLAFTFIYSFVFGDSFLEFMNGAWSAVSQQESFFLPTAGDVGMSILYFVEAAKYLGGGLLVSIALLGFVYLLAGYIFDKRLYPLIGISAILLSPFVFDVFALFSGSAVLYLETLPPYEGNFNERYGMYLIGFITIIPLLLVSLLSEAVRQAKMPRLQNIVSVFLVGLLVGANTIFLTTEAFVEDFQTLRDSADTTLPRDQKELASVLSTEYDGGKILITRALQNYVTVNAGIPLKNYLVESNFMFYENAIEAPWFFARFVVMYNPEIEGIEDWRRAHERVSQVWANDPEFEHYYDLIFENGSERLYKLRESEVVRTANRNNIDRLMIPSLNPEMKRWDLDYVSKYILITSGAETLGKSAMLIES